VVIGRARKALIALASLPALAGCVGTPTPLAPAIRGSIGVPHQGVITNAAPLKQKGEGYELLRNNGVRWGNPRLVQAIEGAAAVVARARPGGALLIVGDLSPRWGGSASGHRSHRTGRDADLLFFVTTPSGQSIPSPGFVRFQADGLAEVEADGKKTFVRIDVPREWQLVKALVTSQEANVQWLFCAHWLEAMIIEYARARGEDDELIWRAESVLLQPGDSSAHDDHLHLRIACTPEESVAGCMGGGPYWPWLPQLPELAAPPDNELLASLIGDLVPAQVEEARGP
jgi:penicillin-insensitive murein endopeptidase